MTEEKDKPEDQRDRQRNYLQRIETGGELSTSRYEPANLPSLQDFAHVIASSGLCPEGLQGKPQDVTMVLIAGAERKLTMMQSLQNLHVIYGRIAISAVMLRAQVLADPMCEEFRLTDLKPDSASIIVRRKDWPEGVTEKVTYTVEDAKKAGYYDRPKSRWPKEGGRMCIARVTTVAADAYFPGVKAGLFEVTEAQDEEVWEAEDAKPVSRKAAKAAAALREPEEEADPGPEAEDEVVDAEIVDEEPEEEAEPTDTPATTKLPPHVIAKTAALLQKEVAGMGKKNTEALIDAGYVDLEKLASATQSQLSKIPGIGAQTAANLSEWAQARLEKRRQAKEDPPAETQQDSEGADQNESAVFAPYLMPPDREPPECPPGLKKRPIYRGRDYIEGIGRLCLKHGVLWTELEKQAKELSGGYPIDRLSDPQWEQLNEWVRSGEIEDPEEGDKSSPKWVLITENLGGETIDQRKADRLLKASDRTNLEPDLEDQIWSAFGVLVEDLPAELYMAAWDLATGDSEGWVESLAALESGGLIKEASDG